MIPSPWTAIVLTLASYRLVRLVGWDDFPPIARVRSWVLGERWITHEQAIARAFQVPPTLIGLPEERVMTLREFVEEGAYVDADGVTRAGIPPWGQETPVGRSEPISGDEPASPGEAVNPAHQELRVAYTRPLLAHLVHCAFCLSWWISLAVYAAWLVVPAETLYAAVPFAVAGAVGLISKNWDA